METVSRIKAVLRRCAPEEMDDVLRIGEIVLDDKKHAVSVSGENLRRLVISRKVFYPYYHSFLSSLRRLYSVGVMPVCFLNTRLKYIELSYPMAVAI